MSDGEKQASSAQSDEVDDQGDLGSDEDAADANKKLEVLYTTVGDNGEDLIRVHKFSTMFLPTTDKLKSHMAAYNRKIMRPVVEFENEAFRARKRDLKEAYKGCLSLHVHKA